MYPKKLSTSTEREVRLLDGKQSAALGLISKDDEQEHLFTPTTIIEEENKITLKFKFDEKKRHITLSKETSKLSERLLISISYILLSDYANNYKQKSRRYLELALKNNSKTILPYYLYAKEGFYINDSDNARNEFLWDLRGCEDYDDVTPEFYKQILKIEDSKLKRIGIAKKAIQKFKDNDYFIYIVANHYFELDEYEEAYEFINKYQSTVTPTDTSDTWDDLLMLYFKICLKLKKFDEAEKIISCIEFQQLNQTILKAILYFEKNELDKSEEYFISVVQDDFGHLWDTRIGLFYLLEIYRLKKQKNKFSFTIADLDFYHDDYSMHVAGYDFSEFAGKSLPLCIDFSEDEEEKAKLSALYAYYLYSNHFHKFENEHIEPKSTKKDVKVLDKCLELCTRSLRYYPDSKFINAIFSKIFYLLQQYDDAKTYSLISDFLKMERHARVYGVYCPITLCSENYRKNFPTHIEKMIKEEKYSLTTYRETEFSQNVGDLFKNEEYKTLVKLYELATEDLSYAVQEELLDYGGSLFQVAYSYAELQFNDVAIKIYEYLLSKDENNTACLNNISNLYKAKGALEKAKSFIERAKKILGDKHDTAVERNYETLIQGNISSAPETPKIANVKSNLKPKIPTFDDINGLLIFDTDELGKTKICDNGSQEWYICKKVMDNQGKSIDEQEIEEAYNIGEPKNANWIKDAVIRINRKVKKIAGVALILHRNAKVRIAIENFEH